MKRHTLGLLALSASLLTAGSVVGQTKPAAADAAPKQQKLVRVATLENAQANREFQANVQLLQAQRQAAIQLDAEIKAEKDAKKKKEKQAELDKLIAKLNENDKAMQKAYGFSLSRNYTMEIEKSSIYMLVTDEEAAKIDKAAATAAKK
jgi:hypothetical protein